MTLTDFFAFLSQNSFYTLGYLIGIPILAAIIGLLVDEKVHLDPWRYIYMILLYMICVPGIFAVTLLVYSFLFEHISIYDIDLITHVLPVISMVVTILVVKKYISLDDIPGFGKLTGLIMMIFTVLIIMWAIDRLRLVAFIYLPIQYVLLILVALLLVFRLGLKRLM